LRGAYIAAQGFFETYMKTSMSIRPPATEFQPNSPKNNRWPKIPWKKMRLAENPPNSKISAAAENNCG